MVQPRLLISYLAATKKKSSLPGRAVGVGLLTAGGGFHYDAIGVGWQRRLGKNIPVICGKICGPNRWLIPE